MRYIRNIAFILFFATCTGSLWAQHTITYWPDNKDGAVSLSFDDSLPSHLSLAIPLLDSMGIKGTFYVITNNVTANNQWSAWRLAAANGHEIGSHTLSHPYLTQVSSSQLVAELQQSRDIINTQIPLQKCLTFAYPSGDFNATVKAAAAKYYLASRGVTWNLNVPPYDFTNLQSRGDDPGSSLGDMEVETNKAASYNRWLILYLHSMDLKDGYGSWGINTLSTYLNFLVTKNLWIGTVSATTRFVMERDSATLKLLSSSSGQIVLNLTDNLDNSIFDQPLTIRSEVPTTWKSVIIQQGTSIAAVTPVVESGKTVIYYKAVPDQGSIALAPLALQITALNPSFIGAGNANLILGVTGSMFGTGSKVRWNGSNRTTTYVSSTQLQASIVAADVAVPGTASISVINPDGSVSNAVSFQIKDVTLASVSANPTSVTGGSSSQGTVTLAAAAPTGGIVVALSSNNSAIAGLPASVTIPSGSTTAVFTITTSAVSTSTAINITASYSGTVQSAVLTVMPPVLSSLILNPTSITGGGGSQGILTLSGAAPSGGLVVSISGNSSAASEPASVTVAAGSTTVTFDISTIAVSSSTSVTISATSNGTSKTAVLTVNPAALTSVSLNPTSVVGGNSSQGTVTLTGPAPSNGIVVTLTDNSSAASEPTSVTVTSGNTSATFTITTIKVSASTTVTITAKNGTTSKTATLILTASAALSSVSLNPTSVIGGSSSQGTITLSGPAPTGGITISLTDNASAASEPASVTVAAGSSTATFTVTTVAVSSTTAVTLTASYNGTSKTAALTLTPQGLVLIPTAGWTLKYADSQELVGENGAAANAFDGDPNTIWHTAWLTNSPPAPHEIQIDMGTSHIVSGFRYLPRQDGGVNGRVGQYEFYLSQDGVNWGTAVATGTFANSASEQEVQFSTAAARYVRLRALTEANGNPWTSVAELRLLGQ